jgi:hypothetical protein
MISDILLYQITLKQKVPFLFFFKKRKDIVYQLHYRVDEDRHWYTKMEGNKVIYAHHTKNNIVNSMNILQGITKRIDYLRPSVGYDFEIFDLSSTNPALFEMVNSIGKDVELIKRETDDEKPRLRGMLLPNK